MKAIVTTGVHNTQYERIFSECSVTVDSIDVVVITLFALFNLNVRTKFKRVKEHDSIEKFTSIDL